MMATPLSMMALWNKPVLKGDRIYKENVGDPASDIPEPHLLYTPPTPSLKTQSQEAPFRILLWPRKPFLGVRGLDIEA